VLLVMCCCHPRTEVHLDPLSLADSMEEDLFGGLEGNRRKQVIQVLVWAFPSLPAAACGERSRLAGAMG